jgi:hypothetical protein
VKIAVRVNLPEAQPRGTITLFGNAPEREDLNHSSIIELKLKSQ